MFRSPRLFGGLTACVDGKFRPRYPDGVWTPPSASWQLAAPRFVTARIPLEMVAPRAGITTGNRYYRAYPGILFRVPVVVLGGAAPFKYEITSGPSWLSVGQVYDDLNYAILTGTPTGTGTDSVTVQVTDQQGAVVSTTWTITRTTVGFIFVDAGPAGSDTTGDGSIGKPFKTMNGWYKSDATDSTHAGKFVYYRAGTYSTSVLPAGGADNGQRVSLYGARKPKVHMAYPGETVVVDTSTAALLFEGEPAPYTGNYFMQGISFPYIGGGGDYKAWEFSSGCDHIGSFECSYSSPSSAPPGSNAAGFMSRANDYYSNYVFAVGNIFNNLPAHDFFLAYFVNKFVAERNVITNCGGHGFYAKTNNTNWSIRFNTGLTGNTAELCSVDAYATADNIEICWNNYKSTGSGYILGPNHPASASIGTVWSYRNTWQIANQLRDGVTVGNLVVINDVIKYTNGSANSHGFAEVNGGAFTASSFTGEECVGTGMYVDDTGNLINAYVAQLGLRGHRPAA